MFLTAYTDGGIVICVGIFPEEFNCTVFVKVITLIGQPFVYIFSIYFALVNKNWTLDFSNPVQ